jgi:pimeloyl-ACP methyl ester carboxylesterase
MAKPIVLVHGAWHAGWCWKYITPILEQQGHRTIAVDLPGHGDNIMDFNNIHLSTYVGYLVTLIQSLGEPVIVVGHSLAGVAISQVGENIPELIKKLFYVTAYLPESGGSLISEVGKSSYQPLSPELLIDVKRNRIELKKSSKITDLFYNLCSEEDNYFSIHSLQKEPYRPFTETIHVTESRFGKIKKIYIECLKDNVIPREEQKRMYSQHRCKVVSLDADHSPFFSSPHLLANAILTV